MVAVILVKKAFLHMQFVIIASGQDYEPIKLLGTNPLTTLWVITTP